MLKSELKGVVFAHQEGECRRVLGYKHGSSTVAVPETQEISGMDTTPRCKTNCIGCGQDHLAVILFCSTVFGARVHASDAVAVRIGAEATWRPWQPAWTAWLCSAIPLACLLRLPCAAAASRPATAGSAAFLPAPALHKAAARPIISCRPRPCAFPCLPQL